ncbi:MAG: O-antigen ligase family protein [Deltaproteobacteria bacterium]|nr:O-antigen ligase family protein [Deltaproteobacteria bacterium]
MRSWITPLLPALLLGLFAAWAGTFSGGGSWAGAAGASVAVVLFSCLGRHHWRDPLGLGPPYRWLVALLLLAVAISWWLSPVQRAGRLALILLPSFLLLPAAVAHCWRGEASRRRGLAAVSAVVAGIAGWCLWDYYGVGSPRAGAPLGHHTYLAAWLVLLLPLAVLGVRRPGAGRWWAAAAAVLGAAAVAASRSLLGGLGLALEVGVAAYALAGESRSSPVGKASLKGKGEAQGRGQGPEPGPSQNRGLAMSRLRRLGRGLGPFLLLATVAALPRWRDLVHFQDSSLLARWTYWQGGLQGLLEKPWVGWGPGSVPWTLAEHLRPQPGINPPGEIVGDLHSLPLHLGYELGLPALILVIVISGLTVRRSLASAKDRSLGCAALLGLAGFGVASLGGAPFSVTALPIALAVALGGYLAAWPQTAIWERQDGTQKSGPLWLFYGVLVVVTLLPLLRAQWHYERASEAESRQEQGLHMEAAVSLDPHFPLYTARAAWLQRDLLGDGHRGDVKGAALRMLASADSAAGVSSLWLAAGVESLQQGASWSVSALEQSCVLAPLSPTAPFLLCLESADDPARWDLCRRSLLAAPRLLAAPIWRRRPELLEEIVDAVLAEPGLEPGWRTAFAAAAESVSQWPLPAAEMGAESAEEDFLLRVGFDKSWEFPASLLTFRRRPWPAAIVEITGSSSVLGLIQIPPASILPSTSPSIFSPEGCRVRE